MTLPLHYWLALSGTPPPLLLSLLWLLQFFRLEELGARCEQISLFAVCFEGRRLARVEVSLVVLYWFSSLVYASAIYVLPFASSPRQDEPSLVCSLLANSRKTASTFPPPCPSHLSPL
ncbi:hypothetical protein BDY24DRAFT_374064, partial [Mrakia frigida]|uniref:uncharacterized protein n=1 Tax=Mrakia frigida TaxID=29902 RepID=UPI003FCC2200